MRIPSSRKATREKSPLTTPPVAQHASSFVRLILGSSTPNLTLHQEHSLYVIIWHLTYADVHQAWAQERSAARRWATGDSTEWLALAEAQNMTDATRLLRLLCNALPGRARWRPNSQRAALKCHACAAQPVQLVWRSPSPPEIDNGEDGMAWCSACIQPEITEHSWASLPEHMIPSTLREQAYSVRQGRDDLDFDTRQSHFGACPLCGMGEAKPGQNTFGNGALPQS